MPSSGTSRQSTRKGWTGGLVHAVSVDTLQTGHRHSDGISNHRGSYSAWRPCSQSLEQNLSPNCGIPLHIISDGSLRDISLRRHCYIFSRSPVARESAVYLLYDCYSLACRWLRDLMDTLWAAIKDLYILFDPISPTMTYCY